MCAHWMLIACRLRYDRVVWHVRYPSAGILRVRPRWRTDPVRRSQGTSIGLHLRTPAHCLYVAGRRSRGWLPQHQQAARTGRDPHPRSLRHERVLQASRLERRPDDLRVGGEGRVVPYRRRWPVERGWNLERYRSYQGMRVLLSLQFFIVSDPRSIEPRQTVRRRVHRARASRIDVQVRQRRRQHLRGGQLGRARAGRGGLPTRGQPACGAGRES